MIRPASAPRSAAVLLLALAFAPAAWAAPDFIQSGRAPDLDQKVLAEDALGPATALDVLCYLKMANRPEAGIPVEQWLAAEGGADAASMDQIRSAVREFLAARKLAQQGSADACDPDYRRALTHVGAEAAWIELTVQPEIQITATDLNRYYIAHSETYAAPDRAQVRNIFLPVEDMNALDQVRVVETELEELRGRILRGDLTFGEAARQFSKAPSGAAGGLLPEFTRGTHFAEFEFNAFKLDEPGRMSPVFVGKDGVYLLQLVKVVRVRKLEFEEVEDEIRRQLSRDTVASYYRFLSGKLRENVFTRDLSPLWQYQDLSAPVAVLDGRKLRREVVYRLNPGVINAEFQLQWNIIQEVTQGWLEGESILSDLEKRHEADHVYLQKARGIADVFLASQNALDARVDPAKFRALDAALQTLGMEPGSAQAGIRQTRVIQITLAPAAEALAAPGQAEITRQTMRELSDQIQKGEIPIRPDPVVLNETLTAAVSQGQEAMDQELKRIRGLLLTSPYANVKLQIEDLGWKDSPPFLAWSPLLPSLRPGEVSPAQHIGNNAFFYYNAGVRLDAASPWLDKPIAIQSLAHDVEKQNELRKAMEAVPDSDLRV